MIKYPRFGQFLVDRFGAVVKKGEEYNFNCPKCGDTKRHFSFNLRLGVSNCFRCGYKPTPFEFLRENTELSIEEIKELLKVEKANTVEKSDFSEKELLKQYVEGISFPENSYKIDEMNDNIKSIVKQWLFTQRVKEEDVEKIGFRALVGDTLRIIIPCYDMTGEVVVYWLARAIANKVDTRYLYPAGIKRSAVFWGEERVQVWSDDKLIWICEGWKDAYRMNGLALLGSQITEWQLKMLRVIKNWYKAGGFVVLLDEDAKLKGYEVAKRIVSIKDIGKVYFAELNNLKDPGDGKDMQDVLQHTDIHYFGSNGVVENRSEILQKFVCV